MNSFRVLDDINSSPTCSSDGDGTSGGVQCLASLLGNDYGSSPLPQASSTGLLEAHGEHSSSTASHRRYVAEVESIAVAASNVVHDDGDDEQPQTSSSGINFGINYGSSLVKTGAKFVTNICVSKQMEIVLLAPSSAMHYYYNVKGSWNNWGPPVLLEEDTSVPSRSFQRFIGAFRCFRATLSVPRDLGVVEFKFRQSKKHQKNKGSHEIVKTWEWPGNSNRTLSMDGGGHIFVYAVWNKNPGNAVARKEALKLLFKLEIARAKYLAAESNLSPGEALREAINDSRDVRSSVSDLQCHNVSDDASLFDFEADGNLLADAIAEFLSDSDSSSSFL